MANLAGCSKGGGASSTAAGALPPAATITWPTPAPIPYGTSLSATQLDATANTAGTFTYSSPAGMVLTAGTHVLSTAFAPSNPTLYSSATASVSLSVTQVTPVVTWPAPAAIAHGAALGSAQLDATASVPGTFLYTPAAGTVLPAGTQTLSVTFTPSDSVDYAAVTQTASISVGQIVPAVTWSAPPSTTVDVPLSSTQLDATASVPGTFVYTPVAGTVLAAGTHTLSVTFTPTDTTDYTTVTKTTSITLGTPSYTWGNVAIVGGGYVNGIVVDSTAANVRYARTDVGGAYSWNQTVGAWVPITDFFSRASTTLGGCESIAIDPTNANNLYLSMGQYTESYGTNGVFLISTNAQQSGGPTFTQVPAPFKMGSNDNGRTAGERMAVDPNLPTKLYYGSYKDGLWVSTNSAASWSKVTTFPVYSTVVGGAGTGGATSSSSTGYAGAGIVFVDFVATSGSSGTATPVIYIGVSDTGTSGTGYSSLYVSTNAGSTWTAVSGQPTGFYPIRGVLGATAAGANSTLYLAYSSGAAYTTGSPITYGIGPGSVSGGALYRYVLPTTPGATGGTWTNITPGTSVRPSYSQGGFASITADPNNPGVIMATTLDDYYPGDDIYRSINYGASWNSLVYKQGATYNTSLSPWLLFGASSIINNAGTWPSSIVIDPANSDHVMYGTGQTLWDSTNIQVSDAGSNVTFNVGANGIEETVVEALSSPPSGPYVVSGVGDLGGFVSTSLTTSPANGMILNDAFSPIDSIDFAQNLPATFAIVGNGTTGAYSTNSGSSWTKFAAAPSGTTAGAGQIAVSASGGTFVWATSDAPVAYTTNNGTTWAASTGATRKSGVVVADRINANKFYIYSSGTTGNFDGTLQISTNGGQSFTSQATGLTNNATLFANYAAEGDLWLGSTTNGLYHSTNSGVSFSSVAGFAYVYAIGFGAAASGASYPAIYVIGQQTSSSSTYGIFRSVNEGSTWIQINDTNHQWGYAQPITGDPKTFGTVYIGTGGRGIINGVSSY